MMRPKGLYVHIPFCFQKCAYCSYVSFPFYDKEVVDEYLHLLKREIDIYSHKFSEKALSSIYFGGGTPSIINASSLADILFLITEKFQLSFNPEITIEVNPDHFDFEELRILRGSGFNRLSIGVQSTSPKLLSVLGRTHSKTCAIRLVNAANKSGFENISVDILYGFPYQSLSDWQSTLQEVVSWDIKHIYACQLSEEDFSWEDLLDKKQIPTLDEDAVLEMYMMLKNYLFNKGFKRYSISSWAQIGYESQHNKTYLLNEEYLGIGVSAASHMNGKRFRNTKCLEKYFRKIKEEKLPVSYFHNLDRSEQMAETMIMNLSLLSGVEKDNFKKKFGFLPEDIYGEEIEKLTSLGLLKNTSQKIFLTEKGLLFADIAAAEFI